MKIDDLISRPRPFASVKEVENVIVQFVYSALSRREKSSPKLLLLYDTQKQRTWLGRDSNGVYCILDWTREPKPRVRWYILERPRAAVADLSVYVDSINERDGLIRIDGKKARHFSRHLFPDGNVKSKIIEFLQSNGD